MAKPQGPKMEVRGSEAFSRQASAAAETAAFIADLGFVVLFFFGGIRILGLSPVPHWVWLVVLTALFAIFWFFQKHFFHRTLGEAIWKLRAFPLDERGKKFGLFQSEMLSTKVILNGIFLTAAVWSGTYSIAKGSYKNDPRWLQSENWKLAPFLPNLKNQSGPVTWFAAPFFYSLGTWPKTYQGAPIFYSVPYEKGPPQKFIGHIIARWQNPDIEVTFEGPKTPASQIPRTQIRRCIGPAWTSPLLDFGCMKVREAVLTRHIEEMAQLKPNQWTLRWFVVNNPALPPDELAQGFYLQVSNDEKTQARFVVVTKNGTNQAFILTTSTGPKAAESLKIFENSVASLRVSDDLNSGRAWIDKQIQAIDLGPLFKETATANVVEKLALVQAILISKLSVEPKIFETYYHLAGTSLLLLRHSSEKKNPDWALTAKPLIQSAYRYAQDVAPQHKDLPKLQNLWLETKKY